MASKLDNHYEMNLESRRSGLSFAAIAAELDQLGVTTEKTSIRE